MVGKPSHPLRAKGFTAGLALVAILLLLWLGRHYYGQLGLIREASLSGVCFIALVQVSILWLQGVTLSVGLAPFSPGISALQGFALSVTGSYANLILPRSGIATTAAYLNRQCGLHLINFSSVLLYNAALFVLSSSAVAAGTLIWLLRDGPSYTGWLLLATSGLFLSVLLTLAQSHRLATLYRGPGAKQLRELHRATRRMACSRHGWSLPVLHLILAGLRALRLVAAFHALGLRVDLVGVLTASALSDLAFLFSVTPSGLGFREAVITVTAQAMSTSADTALSAAILDRIVFSVTIIVLAQIVLAIVLRMKSKISGQPTATASQVV